MAQAGFTPIQLYFSTTSTNTPTAGNLVNGELAINIPDGKLFYKDGATVKLLASNASSAATVSSVGLSAPSIFTVTNSPVTTSARLTLSYSGTALPVANGGTNATSAGIAAFNNITGYSASGATGTTSTNLVFSTSPTLTTPVLGVAASTQVNFTNTAVTVSGNAGTVPINTRLNTFTNSSAAAMTITMATASATDGQMSIVRIYDFSAVAQTITWVNTEDSSVTVPTTSNGSTTLPLTVGFMYNSQTSLWRCLASA